LKRSECDFQVGSVRLEVVQSRGNLSLELGRSRTRWARGRDLVKGAHICGVVERGILALS
jgi:hypothetical protein